MTRAERTKLYIDRVEAQNRIIKGLEKELKKSRDERERYMQYLRQQKRRGLVVQTGKNSFKLEQSEQR